MFLDVNSDWYANHLATSACVIHSFVKSHVSSSFRFKFARISRIWHSIHYDVDVKTTVHLAKCCKCSCAWKISKNWTLNVKSQNSITFQNSITKLSMFNHFANVNAWRSMFIATISLIDSIDTSIHENHTCIVD